MNLPTVQTEYEHNKKIYLEFIVKLNAIMLSEADDNVTFTSTFLETIADRIFYIDDDNYRKEFFKLLAYLNTLVDQYKHIDSNHILYDSFRLTLIESMTLAEYFFIPNQPGKYACDLYVLTALSDTLHKLSNFVSAPFDATCSTQLFISTQKLVIAADYINQNTHGKHMLKKLALVLASVAVIAFTSAALYLSLLSVMTMAPLGAAAGLLATASPGVFFGIIKFNAPPTVERFYTKNIAEILANECGVVKTGFFGSKNLIAPRDERMAPVKIKPWSA